MPDGRLFVDTQRGRASTAAARASHPELDRNHAPPIDPRAGQNAATMSVLYRFNRKKLATKNFVMQ
jgi:hypothetical protein